MDGDLTSEGRSPGLGGGSEEPSTPLRYARSHSSTDQQLKVVEFANSYLKIENMLLVTVILSLAFVVGAIEGTDRLEACNVEFPDLTIPLELGSYHGRRSQVCTFQMSTSADKLIKITFHGLRKACNLKSDAVIVKQEGEASINMCNSDANEFVSSTRAVLVRYHTATDLKFSVSEVDTTLGCVETLTYEHFGRSLTVSTDSSNKTCLITFPGRVQVVIEELNLASPDCDESSVTLLTGSHFYKYQYRLGRLCQQDNGVLDLERRVKCSRGLLMLKSTTDRVDSIRFRIEMPTEEEMGPYLVHDLDC